MENLKLHPSKVKVLQSGNIITEDIIAAFVSGALTRWKTEILYSLIPQGLQLVRECKRLHDSASSTDLDLQLWEKIEELRLYLAKDTIQQKSLLTRLRMALIEKEYSLASNLQQELAEALKELKNVYEQQYCRNLI